MAERGPLSGHILGKKYLLGNVLGEGGFSVVYKAQHLLLHRPQAVKLLHERFLTQPGFRERFLREAQLLATLDHPHIVHIDDFGFDEETQLAYLVMPLIGGGTFADLLKNLKARHYFLPIHQVVTFTEQISQALEYAHQRGVVHLDLKPENLLVDEEGRLLLADFGLAHEFTRERVKGGSSLKHGTFYYMAPEQINGNPQRQSDVYALGVILYQMLIGRRPFEGTALQIIAGHATEQAPPLRRWRPELSTDLEAVVARALAKEVAQRYQSVGELLAALKIALAVAPGPIEQEHDMREKVKKEQPAKTVTMPTTPLAEQLLVSPQSRPPGAQPARASARPRLSPLRFVMLLLIIGAIIGGGAWFALRPASPARTSGSRPSPTATRRAIPAGQITEFPLRRHFSLPSAITMGPDGNLWFTEFTGNSIGRLSPAGQITEFPLPTSDSGPQRITPGPDGNLWFTEQEHNAIGCIRPNGTLCGEYVLPTAKSGPYGITPGSDGNLWFTEQYHNTIGCIRPNGTLCGEYAVPTPASQPYGITPGPDGNLWFTEESRNNIGRLSLDGHFREFSIPTPASQPLAITTGPDGNLWFTEASGNKIGRLSPTGGITAEFILASSSEPSGIVTGPDGNLWFTEASGNKIGWISPTGEKREEYLVPTAQSTPLGITVGPGGKLYFVELKGNRIGCITSGVS